MKIDIYPSTTKPSYGLVILAGTDVEDLQGDAAAAAAKLSPLSAGSKGAILGDTFKGDFLAHLERQIAAQGAGMVKVEVFFDEVIGG